MIKVSVIIPAESFSDDLSRCMEALKKQTFKNFEIIVVVSKITNSKQQILNKFKILNSKLQIINIPELALKPAAKRNWGARKARGAILAFLDDDCSPEVNWIEEGIKSLTSLKLLKYYGGKVGAVGGVMLTPKGSPFWERASGYLLESPIVMGGEYYRNCISEKREVDDYPSANFFIKKKDFLKLGGFDERFWPGEDTRLCLEIVQSGGKILYDPEVVVYHRRRPLFRPFLEQAARYGRQRGRFVRLFPQTSRKIGYFLPSVLVIFLMLCLIFWKWGIVLYLAVVLLEATRIAIKEKNVLMGIFFMIGVILTHMVYGLSFLRGLL